MLNTNTIANMNNAKLEAITVDTMHVSTFMNTYNDEVITAFYEGDKYNFYAEYDVDENLWYGDVLHKVTNLSVIHGQDSGVDFDFECKTLHALASIFDKINNGTYTWVVYGDYLYCSKCAKDLVEVKHIEQMMREDGEHTHLVRLH